MSYRLKLTITISLLIALSFGIGGTLMITTSFNASLEKETQAALHSFETVQNTLYLLNSLGEQTDYKGLSSALSQMREQNSALWYALTLVSGDNLIYQDGELTETEFALPIPSPDQCSYAPVADSYGNGLLVKSVIAAGDETMELTARFDLSMVYETRAAQQKLYLIIYVIVVLFGILSAALLSVAMTQRLHRLTWTVRQIAGGDLTKRSRILDQDEFGQLSRDLDSMADKMQENITKLETEMQRQESFMGSFAHELKTPMTSIIGFSDLLRQGNLDENTRMMAADYIHSESRRLERLSFKLLDLILLKKDGLAMKRVPLNAFLAEIERAMAPVMKNKNIRLVCRADHHRVILEPDLVKSLVYNLIDNASKAIEGEGIIAVKATAIPGGCEIQVVDNGRGMEADQLSRVTEAFYRVDKARSRSQGGAGLGLALCKQIVELHNGDLRFASEPGKGTRVTVTLYGKAGDRDEP